MLLGFASIAIAIAPIVSCLKPTQITVRVETDIPCGPGGEGELADVLVGAGGSTVGELALKGACAGGLVGTATVVPGKNNDAVDITVVGAIGATKCTIDSLNEGGCIVAKRRLSFIDHIPLEITVRLDAACAGLDCGDGTCSEGKCIPKTCTTDCGDGGTDGGPTPVITSLSAGGNSTCAIVSTGDVVCWGESTNGKLFAKGPIKATVTPALFGAKALALGRAHGCGIFPEGPNSTVVKCWGANDKYQAGSKTIGVDVTTPTSVTDLQGVPLANVTAITAGDDFNCAIAGDGHVLCWGDGAQAQIGTLKSTGTPNAIQVANVASASGIAAGASHACARGTFSGTNLVCANGACGVVCWGANQNSQCSGVADGWVPPKGVPIKADLLAAGGDRTLAIVAGDVGYWGQGVGALPPTTIPVKPALLPKAIAVSGGTEHACLVTAVGNRPFCVANDGNFSVGLSGIASKFTTVVSGWKHACGITANGAVWCWGANDQWQLGGKDAKSPNRVNGL